MSLPGYGSLEVSCMVGKPCMELHIHELIGFISSLLQLMYQVTKLHKGLAEKVLFCTVLSSFILYLVCFFLLVLLFLPLLSRPRICLLTYFFILFHVCFFFCESSPVQKIYIISLSLETNSKTSRFV